MNRPGETPSLDKRPCACQPAGADGFLLHQQQQDQGQRNVIDKIRLGTNAHPLWTHPAITITPHTAALTEPRTAIPQVVENVERLRRGQPPLNLVDLDAGY